MAPQIGDHVVFVDPFGAEHDALVTQTWNTPGPHPGDGTDTPALNVVCVDADEAKTDSYGRQIARSTSVVHQSHQAAHGMYWREP